MLDHPVLIITFIASAFSIILFGEFLRMREVKHVLKGLKALGEAQGLVVNEGLKASKFHYDIVWRKRADGNPTHVFVLKRGDAKKTLTELKHAFDLWQAKPYLILNRKGMDQVKALLNNNFHEIENNVRLISFKELKEILSPTLKYFKLLDELKVSYEPGSTVSTTLNQPTQEVVDSGCHKCTSICYR